MLHVSNLTKSFGTAGRRTVLRGIDLTLNAGEYIAVVGESGSGKSTLLNLIAGLDNPDSGSIVLNGVDLVALDDTQRTLLRRRDMGFVFQAFHVLPHLTVAANVALPLDLAGLTRSESMQRARAMLDAVALGSSAPRYPRELSGGELQRVAIARALVHRPQLLLADEPTGNLDADTAASIIALLAQTVRSNGAAGILVTHSAAAAASADRIYRLTADGLHPQSQ